MGYWREEFEQGHWSLWRGDGATEVGDPGLPTSLMSLEYEEKNHGSRGGAMAEDDQEQFLQKKEENKWERRDVGKCVSYLHHA